MTFTYDISTDIGKVRFWLNDRTDTPEGTAYFTDEEIQFALDQTDTVNEATLFALDAKLIEFATPDYKADEIEERNFKQAFDSLSKLRDILANRFGLASLTATVVQPYRAEDDDS